MAMAGLANLAHALEAGASEMHVEPEIGAHARLSMDHTLAFAAALENGSSEGLVIKQVRGRISIGPRV